MVYRPEANEPSRTPAVRYVCEADASGYAVAARRCVGALASVGVDIAWEPLEDTMSGRVRGLARPDAPALLRRLLSERRTGEVNVYHSVPTAWPTLRREMGSAPTVGHVVWETDQLPERWHREMAGVDAVWVPTYWNQWVFDHAGLGKKVHVVPHVIATDSPELPPVVLPDGHTVFVLASAWDWRKRPDRAIEAFLRAFTADDPVTLVVKTTATPIAWPQAANTSTVDHIAAIVAGVNRPASVIVDTSTWTDAQMLGLLAQADCVVSLTASEGWGLGAFDAATFGTPVLITGYGGQVEWLGSDYPGLIPFSMVPADHPDKSLFEEGMRWGYADMDAAVDMMRSVASKSFPELTARAAALGPELQTRFSPEAVGLLAANALSDLVVHPPIRMRRTPAPGAAAPPPRVLVLSPIKNVAHEATGYVDRLAALDYPADRLSVGLLEGGSTDGTFVAFRTELQRLADLGWRTTLTKRDFGYCIPDGVPRWEPTIQLERRRVLALSRNHLLFAALADEDWVLWIDADVVHFPTDIIQRLIAVGNDIVQPHCVREPGGPTFDQNGWSHGGRHHLDAFRGMGVVELEAVGGTMLLVRADRHRDGLIWPAYRYGLGNDRIRTDPARLGRSELGEIETEGLAIMANDMGIECWGLPDLEIIHR